METMSSQSAISQKLIITKKLIRITINLQPNNYIC